MDRAELEVDTSTSRWVDLSGAARHFCADKADGLLNVFVPHATAGLAVIEMGSGTESDVEAMLARLLPRDDRYFHRHGSRGHGADHVIPAIVSPSVVLPVIAGQPLLGRWQSIVLVDLNGDNPLRRVLLSHLAG